VTWFDPVFGGYQIAYRLLSWNAQWGGNLCNLILTRGEGLGASRVAQVTHAATWREHLATFSIQVGFSTAYYLT
jgi:hypothetical protein